jgi:hypothetical protein
MLATETTTNSTCQVADFNTDVLSLVDAQCQLLEGQVALHTGYMKHAHWSPMVTRLFIQLLKRHELEQRNSQQHINKVPSEVLSHIFVICNRIWNSDVEEGQRGFTCQTTVPVGTVCIGAQVNELQRHLSRQCAVIGGK